MLRSYATLFTLLLVVTVSAGHADTYSWTDEEGTVNFSEDLGSVPKKFRKKARKIQENEPLSEEQPAIAPGAGKEPKAMPPVTAGDGLSPDEKFAGKTYAQWAKDLRDREEAMATVLKDIEEIDSQLRAGTTKSNILVDQRNAMLAQYKQMKVEYYQSIESARKAGLQVNMEK